MSPSALMPPRTVSMTLLPTESARTVKLSKSETFQDTGWRMNKSISDVSSVTTRPRGLSDSKLIEIPSSSNHPLSRVTPPSSTQSAVLAPAATVLSSATFSSRVGDALRSSFRERSQSTTRVVELSRPVTSSCPDGGLHLSATSGNLGFWWSRDQQEVTVRPWKDEESNKCSIPDEQKENWEQTRKTVSQAVARVLGTAAVLAHKTLAATVPVLENVPIPGLVIAAKLLLGIWDAVQEVDTNRLAFLRLTERCACIVITLHQEMQDAGEGVAYELSGSLRRIEELFTGIQGLMVKEGNVPFLKRYLKRVETLRCIESLNRQLDQELQILGPSFQIRTVKVIKEFAAGMDERIEAVCQRVLQSHCCSQSITQSITHSPSLTNSPKTPSTLRPASRRILKPLEEILTAQNSKDRQLDQNDLREQIGAVLQSGNDSTMLEFLQIRREDILEAIKSMQRHLEMPCFEAHELASGEYRDAKDTLHLEFIETGIDSLRRMSRTSTNLPSWTITRFEIDCGTRVGVGFFSDVYEGTWRGQSVAVKVLRDVTSSHLFVREVEIWKTLSHPNVLELFGASSASGNPPWFFVSPFAKHGDLGNHLRRLSMLKEQRGIGVLASLSSSSTRTFETIRREGPRHSRECDPHRFMLEIAMGMEYLHEHGVLHGDMKCANILVDKNYTCMISDFGQSGIRAEAFRMSGACGIRGTLRWQAPEVMQGMGDLTPAVDVYAYAISCVEILNMGQMPWNLMDDNAVQFIVLKENGRPGIPSQYHETPVHDILQRCWHYDPNSRPSFPEIVSSMRKIRHSVSSITETPPPVSIPELPEFEYPQGPMSPITLSPCASTFNPIDRRSLLSSRASFHTTFASPRLASEETIHLQEECINVSQLEPGFSIPAPNNDSSSTFLSEASGLSEEFAKADFEMNPKLWEAKNERRYRLLLNHRYHPSLVLALWDPVPVSLGAVGYLSKPSGTFVTLFNAIAPSKASDPRIAGMPSIAGYGKVLTGAHRHATRNAALRGLDAVVGFLSSGKKDDSPASISRRASFPLRAGHKVAHMYTESTEYRYLRQLDAPKMWFKANVDYIHEVYGVEHDIQKEDLALVIGVLETPNYALFVSHDHPDGHVHFHVFSPKDGKPWGVFTTDTETSNDHEGPMYNEPWQKVQRCAYKISVNGDPPKTLLLARLRFKPDALEPTSL